MLSLGIDPGSSHLGVVLLNEELHIIYHTLIITTKSKDKAIPVFSDDVNRYRYIHNKFSEIRNYIDSDTIVCIEPYSPYGQRGTQGSKVQCVIGLLLSELFELQQYLRIRNCDIEEIRIIPISPVQLNSLLPKNYKDIVLLRTSLFMENYKCKSKKGFDNKVQAVKKLMRKQLLAETVQEKIPELKTVLDTYAQGNQEHISDACALAYKGLLNYGK